MVVERRRRLAATLGLVALVLVDLVLVFAALRISGRSTEASGSTSEASGTGAPAPVAGPAAPSATVTPGTDPTSGATTTTAPPAPTVPPVPLRVVITAVDLSTAWRATTGTCGGTTATLALTTTGGRTWQNAKSPYPVLMRVQPTDAARAFVAGGDPNCVMGVRSTTDTGTTWTGIGPGSLAETLTRDAKDPTKVRTPGDRTAAPCGPLVVVDVARSSAIGTQALCADGTLHSSDDDGRTWPQGSQVDGALALDSKVVGGTVTAYVAVTAGGCDGIRLRSVASATVTDLGCAEIGSSLTPGMVALSVPNPDNGWLLVGEQTWRSTDGLKTWARA